MCRVFHEGVLVTSFFASREFSACTNRYLVIYLSHGDAQGEAEMESKKMNTINGVEITTENFHENSSLATQALNLVLFGEEQEINGVKYAAGDYEGVKSALSSIGYKF